MKKKYIWIIFGIIVMGGIIISQYTNKKTSKNPTQEQQKSITYLDIREKYERNAGHVKGAIHLPLGEIIAWNTSGIPRDKSIGIYCRSGNRTKRAMQAFQKQWFTNVIDIGGMRNIQNIEIIQ